MKQNNDNYQVVPYPKMRRLETVTIRFKEELSEWRFGDEKESRWI